MNSQISFCRCFTSRSTIKQIRSDQNEIWCMHNFIFVSFFLFFSLSHIIVISSRFFSLLLYCSMMDKKQTKTRQSDNSSAVSLTCFLSCSFLPLSNNETQPLRSFCALDTLTEENIHLRLPIRRFQLISSPFATIQFSIHPPVCSCT